MLTGMGIKPTTWNKKKLLEAVEAAQGGASEPEPPTPPPKEKKPPVRAPSGSVAPPDDLIKNTMMPPPPVFGSQLSTGSSVAPPEELDNIAPPPNLQEPPTRNIGYSNASVGIPGGLDDLSAPPPAPKGPPTPPPQKRTPPTPPPQIQKKASPPPVVQKMPEPAPSAPKKKKGIAGMAAHWDAQQKKANEENKSNPFSKHFDGEASKRRLQNAPKGRNKMMPQEGTKSYERMLKARAWAKGKIDQLYVEIPKCPGAEIKADGSITCPFGSIFEHYAHIDSVIVGTLKSAKKKGFAKYDNGRAFPLLQQRVDDHVIVTLLPREEA